MKFFSSHYNDAYHINPFVRFAVKLQIITQCISLFHEQIYARRIIRRNSNNFVRYSLYSQKKTEEKFQLIIIL